MRLQALFIDTEMLRARCSRQGFQDIVRIRRLDLEIAMQNEVQRSPRKRSRGNGDDVLRFQAVVFRSEDHREVMSEAGGFLAGKTAAGVGWKHGEEDQERQTTREDRQRPSHSTVISASSMMSSYS